MIVLDDTEVEAADPVEVAEFMSVEVEVGDSLDEADPVTVVVTEDCDVPELDDVHTCAHVLSIVEEVQVPAEDEVPEV